MNLSLGSYILIYCEATGTTNTFLLDTGATISTLKCSRLLKIVQINPYRKCRGIIEGLLTTQGAIVTDISIGDNILLNHSFQIVDDKFPVPADGILGLDFITIFNCVLDYGQEWKLTIRPDNSPSTTIPIYDQTNLVLYYQRDVR